MSRTRPLLVIALLSVLGSALDARALPAQPPPTTAADPTIVATVQRLFDAMAAHDTAVARTLLVPGTRFVSISNDTGPAIPRSQGDSAFLRMLAGRSDRLLERMWAPVVQVQGRIASVWTPYDFHIDGRFSHCGIDTITLLRTDAGWRIAGLLYTVQRTGCAPSPLGPPAETPRSPTR